MIGNRITGIRDGDRLIVEGIVIDKVTAIDGYSMKEVVATDVYIIVSDNGTAHRIRPQNITSVEIISKPAPPVAKYWSTIEYYKSIKWDIEGNNKFAFINGFRIYEFLEFGPVKWTVINDNGPREETYHADSFSKFIRLLDQIVNLGVITEY